MKLYALIGFFTAACLLAAPALAAKEGTTSHTGKVIAVDPDGKAIVIDKGTGKSALTIGAIVGEDTKLTVKGKNQPVADLLKMVKPGDTVTLNYVKTDNIYAKKIINKK